MIKNEPFGRTTDGDVTLYTLMNSNGLELKVMNYGCVVVSLKVPDKKGTLDDIVLGFDSIDQYVNESPFFGAVVGRYANRIAKGMFTLDGITYRLAVNNGPNHLHGGVKAFDKVLWNVEENKSNEGPSLKFRYLSKDGEEGYPGNLEVTVIYSLTNSNEFKVSYKATTDMKTVVNLSQHSYFNFSGNAKRSILDHEIMINADRFVAIDETSIPTGELKAVQGTPFDFRRPWRVGDRIDEDDLQLKNGQGYDHTFVFNEAVIKKQAVAASLYDPVSGRYMEVFTKEPGVQFYSGNFLKGYKGKNGAVYNKRFGLCLETQHFPDSPNQPGFPSIVLSPGQAYETSTAYTFSVR
ncbi:MAG TPA: aldose epimerase family protein [Cyclobacteriaceae bacterium]|nr:aldose epimerase family protein [Cyclobacteriaceae bacterium]